MEIVLILLTQSLDTAATLLAARDANTTGRDDALARILKAASAGVKDYLAGRTPAETPPQN